MQEANKKAISSAVLFLIATAMLLSGFLVAAGGYRVLGQWSSIRPALAAVGVLWLVAGTVMFLAALWVFGSLGRRWIPLVAGGAAAVLAGAVLIVGVLTSVVPCSGPS